jgi:hypothetical protein
MAYIEAYGLGLIYKGVMIVVKRKRRTRAEIEADDEKMLAEMEEMMDYQDAVESAPDNIHIELGDNMYYEEEYYNTGGLAGRGIRVVGLARGYTEYDGESFYYLGDGDDDNPDNDAVSSVDNAEGYCYIWHKESVLSSNRVKRKTLLSNNIAINYGNGLLYCYEVYECGKLKRVGVYSNGYECGYFKSCNLNGTIDSKVGYFLYGDKISDDNEKGHCFIWNSRKIV